MMRSINEIFAIAFLLVSLVYTSAHAEGGDAAMNYALSIENGLVSLNARDASLMTVLEDIGKKMQIDVVNEMSADEKITVTFDKLPLQEAIKQLSSNYVYLTDSEKGKGEISKIVVLPKGSELKYSGAPEVNRKAGLPEAIMRQQPGKGQSVRGPFNGQGLTGENAVETEARSKEEEPQSESADEDREKEEKRRAAPFAFEFDPTRYMKEMR